MGTPPPSLVVRTVLREIQPIRVQPVQTEEGPAWTAVMVVYHPLGFRRAFGAQQKYWVRDQGQGQARVLGGLLVAAAAKALAPRASWIGWDARQRQRIVSYSRYLLMPAVAVQHLASHVLALALGRLPGDWVR